MPDFDAGSWVGVVAPKSTPATIVNAPAQERALADPTVAARLKEVGTTPAPMDLIEFERLIFERLFEEELAKWAPIARATGMQID